MLLYQKYDEKKLDKIVKAQEKIKVSKEKEILISGIEKAIEILKAELKSHNIKCDAKLILYLNYEDIEELFNYMSILHNYQSLYPDVQIILFFNESIAFKLSLGMNMINLSKALFTKKGVGLYPMKKSVLSTKGLKWDISKRIAFI